MTREGRSRMTEEETEAILPGRVSPDMAEIVEDDADGGVETTGEGDRAGSDLEGTGATTASGSVATGANRVAPGTTSSWSSGRANVDAKAKPKPKISQTRASRKSMPYWFPLLCSETAGIQTNRSSNHSGDGWKIVSSLRLPTGLTATALLLKRREILMLIGSFLLSDSRRVPRTENKLGTVCIACFVLFYFSTMITTWLTRYSMSSTDRTEVCSLKRITSSHAYDFGIDTCGVPAPRSSRTSTTGTSQCKVGLGQTLFSILWPFSQQEIQLHSSGLSGRTRHSRSGPNSGRVCCRTVSSLQLGLIVIMLNIQVVTAANIDARVGVYPSMIPGAVEAKREGHRVAQLPKQAGFSQCSKRSYRRAFARACREGGAFYRGTWRSRQWFRPVQIQTKALPRAKPTDKTTKALRILTWNSGGLHSQVFRELETFAKDQVLDIICVQETRWHYDANWVGPDYHFFHSAGLAKEEVNGGGITTFG